jgi:hypothetical protein
MLSEPCFVPIIVALMVTFTVVVCFRLDEGRSMDATGAWPIPALVGFLAFNIVALCYAKWKCNDTSQL